MHATDLELEQLYVTHYPSLLESAISKKVPPAEAIELAHVILVGSLLQIPRISNFDAWIRGSLASAIAKRAVGA